MFAFGGLELAFLLPLVGGLFWARATAAGALISVVGSIALYLTISTFKLSFLGFHAIVPAMLLAIVLYVVGSWLTKPTTPWPTAFFPARKS